MFIVNLIIYYINNKSIYISHLLETLAQNAGVEVVKKAALLAEGNDGMISFCYILRFWFRNSET